MVGVGLWSGLSHAHQTTLSQGSSRFGGQHEASSSVGRQNREVRHSVKTESEKATLRSQSGCGARAALSIISTCSLTRIGPPFFRTLLLRRPLSLTQRNCQCGRPLDSNGHHRTACARPGVLGRRGFAVESAAARVSRRCSACDTEHLGARHGCEPAPILLT